jgi:hypothetical protein
MQIIDGFTVNTAQPIDDRLVTSGTASRNAILYKYNGLRVYDTYEKQPYVWNGSIWTSENSSTVTITGTTTTGYIPIFNGTSQVTNSLISQIVVGNTNYINIANGNNTLYSLKVSGTIDATTFKGSANGLYNIPGAAIIGVVEVSKLSPKISPVSNEIYILKSGISTPEWTALSSLPAGSLPASVPKLDISSVVDGMQALYMSFGTIDGKYKYYQCASGDAFRFIPKTTAGVEGAQLQVPSGTETNPAIAFSTGKNTGIYKVGSNLLGISVGGKEAARFTNVGAIIKSTSTAESTLKVLNSGGRPFIGLYGLNSDTTLMSGTIGFSGLWNNGGTALSDLIIESFASAAAKTYPQAYYFFDENVSSNTDGRRHMINLNRNGQTIIATNAGSIVNTFTGGEAGTGPSPTPNGAYGCEIYNSNPSSGHGLIVRSGGGANTVSARFDNGSKTIAYFTDRGLQIMSGNESAPSICFDSDKAYGYNTGFYLETFKTIGIVAGNKKVLTISDTEIRLPQVSNLAYIFGENTRIEGTSRTASLEIYRPTTVGGWAICHFYSDIGGTKSAKAYIWPDGTYYRLSDRRQKENIKPLEYGLSEILKLKPVTHTWLYSDSVKPSIGLIAQDVEEVLKELVNTSTDGDREIKALDYNGIIPVLIKSIQDLNKKIEILEAR